MSTSSINLLSLSSSGTTSIPLLDLGAMHRPLNQQLDEIWRDTLATSDFISGRAVTEFEEAFAKTCGHNQVVSCANGTDALELVLDALNIGPGDEVIVPAMTWFATAEVVTTRGARVVFADVDGSTNGISPATVLPHLTEDTAAIIAVHLYGHPADLKGLTHLCEDRGVALIEDCAQAHGAHVRGQAIGTWGRAATYSFFPSKNLGCLGDGGAVGTDDEALAKRVRQLASHGQVERHHHVVAGRNSRLDTLQARVLNLKLPHLANWVTERNRLAERYTSAFEGLPNFETPAHGSPQDLHGFHLYVAKTSRRDELRQVLAKADIATAVHYPTPLPLQPAYAHRKFVAADYPEAVRIGQEGISLPLYPGMSDDQQARVIELVKKTLVV